MTGSFADALRAETAATQARILIVDIERRPMLSYHWSPKVRYIPARMNVDKGGMISWAAKWYGQPAEFMSTHHDGQTGMLEGIWRLVDEADFIVGYNSQNFDMPHIIGELVQAGYTEPSPWTNIDLLKAARKKFNLPYNSLGEVCADLGLDTKLETDGFDLWLGCMNGDGGCWERMREYNIHDVHITEQLFDRMRGVLPPSFNLNIARPERVSGCTRCGHADMEEAGFHYAATRVYRRFWCPSCGGYDRATHHEKDRAQYRKGI